uniref:Amidohydrolase 3 domain-containing protein n=1 Tax=uncultured Armatimonadetes bacterium TaxID=157466 RepID=A0A6J4ISH8_9BACT|nr:hypothetical protein AVDCRST_MAG63-2362 [uncultured Armatimonadetes bacterium]
MTLHAHLILTGGNVFTLDTARPRVSALAVRDGRIVLTGDDAAVGALAGPETRRFDLEGRTVVPGFCDAHLHLVSYGTGLLRRADLVGSTSLDDLLDRLRAQAVRVPEGWIDGRGFDQELLAEKRFPTRADLDRISATRPVLIARVCGHATVVNSAALALLTDAERAAGDAESGLYTEGAAGAFYRRMPPLSESEMEEAALAGARAALATGITSVHTLLDTPEQMGAWARLRRSGRLPLRVTGMPPFASVAALHAHGVGTTFGDEWLRFGAAKLFSDGSLGAQTAWLAEPYADAPSTRGIRIYDPDDLKAKACEAQARGFQLAIHAIGDQAVCETLDAIEAALGEEDNRAHRHRIEHVSLAPPDAVRRMAERGIVGVVQPQFVRSDVWTPERVGPERAPWAYPFRTLREAGVPLALSSDAPVERLDAFACLAAAVGRAPWSPEETLSPEEALHAYCLGGAYAAHAEDRLGSLEVGKLADFVVLSGNPTRLDAEGIAGLKAEAVFVGGEQRQSPAR